MNAHAMAAALSLLILLTCAPRSIYSQERRLVKMTLVQNASSIGACKLLGRKSAGVSFGQRIRAGARNWLLQFEGGGWCNDVKSCLERAATRRGSTRYMSKVEDFSGILSNNASLNPDFYNWNRVKLRYCDGASFAGDAKFQNGLFAQNASVKCLSDAGFFLDGRDISLNHSMRYFYNSLVTLQTISEAVGDWYFGRNESKEIDCAYPCDNTCHNLIG
ncbi:UNVERIFIED_CONTAM: Pectin acetylesterase 9 [Sesamum calycinum]|uniref:Pectin acetylesterase n=1 Tax=Sesamum calycinum TaxID=2727403 RepID=A0AAW2J1I2_9LAMI